MKLDIMKYVERERLESIEDIIKNSREWYDGNIYRKIRVTRMFRNDIYDTIEADKNANFSLEEQKIAIDNLINSI